MFLQYGTREGVSRIAHSFLECTMRWIQIPFTKIGTLKKELILVLLGLRRFRDTQEIDLSRWYVSTTQSWGLGSTYTFVKPRYLGGNSGLAGRVDQTEIRDTWDEIMCHKRHTCKKYIREGESKWKWSRGEINYLKRYKNKLGLKKDVRI